MARMLRSFRADSTMFFLTRSALRITLMANSSPDSFLRAKYTLPNAPLLIGLRISKSSMQTEPHAEMGSSDASSQPLSNARLSAFLMMSLASVCPMTRVSAIFSPVVGAVGVAVAGGDVGPVAVAAV